MSYHGLPVQLALDRLSLRAFWLLVLVLLVLMGVLKVLEGCCRVFEVCLEGVWKNKIEV